MQRDAVIAGGVDYGALMYGEHYDSKPEEGAAARQGTAPKGYAAALLSGAKATPEQPVPMKAAAKPGATPQKQPAQPQPQPASAAKPAPSKEAGEKEKGAKPAGKSNRRGKGNRGGNGDAATTAAAAAEAQPAKVWCNSCNEACLCVVRSRCMKANGPVMTMSLICNGFIFRMSFIKLFVLSDGHWRSPRCVA